LLHDHSENAFRVRAERHPDTELLRALIHRETHHPVKTDGGQCERNRAEDREQIRGQAIDAKNFIVQTRRRSGEVGREI
jgi:hypothetical protein